MQQYGRAHTHTSMKWTCGRQHHKEYTVCLKYVALYSEAYLKYYLCMPYTSWHLTQPVPHWTRDRHETWPNKVIQPKKRTVLGIQIIHLLNADGLTWMHKQNTLPQFKSLLVLSLPAPYVHMPPPSHPLTMTILKPS